MPLWGILLAFFATIIVSMLVGLPKATPTRTLSPHDQLRLALNAGDRRFKKIRQDALVALIRFQLRLAASGVLRRNALEPQTEKGGYSRQGKRVESNVAERRCGAGVRQEFVSAFLFPVLLLGEVSCTRRD